MRVGDLLELGLDLRLITGEAGLDRGIRAVVTTDLADPARYLHGGELVLTGLVWWSPGTPTDTVTDTAAGVGAGGGSGGGSTSAGAADRFVAALAGCGAAALAAGEALLGGVPTELVDACRRHRLPLLAVPTDTSFQQVTERVYRLLTGGTAGPAAPALPRRRLLTMVSERAGLPALLASFVDAFGGHYQVRTASGRLVASSQPGPHRPAAAGDNDDGDDLTVPVDPRSVPLPDAWYLTCRPRGGPGAAQAVELAEILALERARLEEGRLADRRLADRLLATLEAGTAAGPAELHTALLACGLPSGAPAVVAVARPGRPPGVAASFDRADTARRALEEALRGGPGGAVVGAGAAEAVAVLPGDSLDRAESALRAAFEGWAARACVGVRVGLAGPVPLGRALVAAVAEARHAQAVAATGRAAPDASALARADALMSYRYLLAGLDEDVRRAFRTRTLGALLAHDAAGGGELVSTLESFLAHSGSWIRCARTLHLHVNTLRYRIGRIEQITGRDLSRLDDRIDLLLALRCGDPSPDQEPR